MHAYWHEPQKLITRALHKKPKWQMASSILLILVKRALTKPQWVNKWPRMKMTLGIYKMNLHRWQVRAFSVLLCWIVRRKKAGKDHNRMEREKQKDPIRDGTPPSQELVSVRMRGSAQ